MKVAIMQPTYLPWSGYFALMQCVDLFVILDSVQFNRRSWQQRNQIKSPRGPLWLTVPVHSKGKKEQLIKDVEIDNSTNYAKNHKNSILMNYKKTPFFKKYAEELFLCIESENNLLNELNLKIITFLQKVVQSNAKILRSSFINCSGAKADLMASICKEVGATTYISVPGSKDYLVTSDAFQKINVKIKTFSFKHPIYNQLFGVFLPSMSFIDMLFNVGHESADLIRKSTEICEL